MSAPYGVQDLTSYESNRTAAAKIAKDLGFREETFMQIQVFWGDQDPNAHLNNAVYFKYLEAGRMSYIRTITSSLPREAASSILGSGKGKGMVVGEVRNRFERPVFAPDHVLVAHKASGFGEKKILLESIIVSFAQRAKVCSGSAIMMGYDYDTLKGAPLHPEVIELVKNEIAETERILKSKSKFKL